MLERLSKDSIVTTAVPALLLLLLLSMPLVLLPIRVIYGVAIRAYFGSEDSSSVNLGLSACKDLRLVSFLWVSELQGRVPGCCVWGLSCRIWGLRFRGWGLKPSTLDPKPKINPTSKLSVLSRRVWFEGVVMGPFQLAESLQARCTQAW